MATVWGAYRGTLRNNDDSAGRQGCAGFVAADRDREREVVCVRSHLERVEIGGDRGLGFGDAVRRDTR